MSVTQLPSSDWVLGKHTLGRLILNKFYIPWWKDLLSGDWEDLLAGDWEDLLSGDWEDLLSGDWDRKIPKTTNGKKP